MQTLDKRMGISPSIYQAAILDAIKNTNDNLIVNACAGSGKTTTLKLICDIIPKDYKSIAVCFNKFIAEEFGRRLPHHVEARTLHSLGLKICREANLKKNVRINDHKLGAAIYKYIDHIKGRALTNSKKKIDRIWAIMFSFIPLVYATRTDPTNQKLLIDLANEYGILGIDEHVEGVREIVSTLRSKRTELTFDDMIDHPLFHNYPMPKYDFILVDEGQDLNKSQMEFIARLAHPETRFVIVGDRRQAIYGFRGANTRAIDDLKDQFNCQELPLSFCYRCGSKIVEEAQKIVGDEMILPAPDAIEGKVYNMESSDYKMTMDSLKEGDMVVCRTNAPLVAPCFSLIRRGQKAIIKGREIGVGLHNIIDEVAEEKKVTKLYRLLEVLQPWKLSKITDLIATKKYQAAQSIEDKVDTIVAIAEQASSITNLHEIIDQVFSDNLQGVIFSSIHKAKGTEANLVVLLAPELIPHPMVQKFGTLADADQEENLNYVARTRAKEVLIYQPLPEKKNH